MAEESEAEEEMLHLTKTSESGESKTGESGKKKGRKGSKGKDVCRKGANLQWIITLHEIIILLMMIIAWS